MASVTPFVSFRSGYNIAWLGSHSALRVTQTPKIALHMSHMPITPCSAFSKAVVTYRQRYAIDPHADAIACAHVTQHQLSRGYLSWRQWLHHHRRPNIAANHKALHHCRLVCKRRVMQARL